MYVITIYSGDREWSHKFETKEEVITIGVDIWKRMQGTVYEPFMFEATHVLDIEAFQEGSMQMFQAESFTNGSLIVDFKKEKNDAAISDD